MVRFLAYIILGSTTAALVLLAGLALYDAREKYPSSTGAEIPGFKEIAVDFNHSFDILRGIPYAAGAVIDIDNDGKDEIFLGGGLRQPDALLRYDNGTFVDVSDQVSLVKLGAGVTTGAAVLDTDGNGFSDLLISRENGIFLYSNDNGMFSLKRLEIQFRESEIPLGVTITDLNRDGKFDFFVPVVERGTADNLFLLRETETKTLSRLFINNGDGSFFDLTESVGLEYSGGALQSVFTDLDADGLEDMVVLYTDGTLGTWKNHGKLLFEQKHHSMTNLKGDFMGMGTGDYNGDGRVDFLLTARGSTIPDFMARLLGGIRPHRHGEWVLMKNMGYFSFHNDSTKAQLSKHGFARGALFADLNGDGKTDLAAAHNHPYWPVHMISSFRLPGGVLLQDGEEKFFQPEALKSLNSGQLGLTPLVADIDGNGWPDLLFVNLGGRARVFLHNRGKSRYLKVVLPDTVKSLGAVVTVKTLGGMQRQFPFLPGAELCSDSSHALFIGLGQDKATDVMVRYGSGKTDQTSGVLFNTAIRFN